VNFMMLVWPTRIGLDAWGEIGNEGWSYDALAPYLNKFATVHDPSQAQAVRADGTSNNDNAASIHASFSAGYNMANAAWMKAFSSLGFETRTSDEVRAGTAIGAFQQPASINPASKTRSYAATEHYSEKITARSNLTVMTETLVKRVIFNSTAGTEPIATGVLAKTSDGSEKVYKVAGEVILAAGSLMSPQILELSGIGSKTVLDKYGIPIIVENEWVGENVQDHPVVCQSFEVKPEVPSMDALRNPSVLEVALAQFQDGGQGPLGQSNISAAYLPLVDEHGLCSDEAKKAVFTGKDHLIKNAEDELLRRMTETTDEPTVEYILFPSQVDTTIKVPGSMADYTMPERPENFITVMAMLNHPFSRGSVHITSGDVHEKPSWDPNFGSNPLDFDILGRHVQFVERIIETEPFSDILKSDGARFPDVRGDTMEGAVEIIRRSLVSLYHPAGSCGMRPRDKGGVVDSRLRVYGVKGLRVVDASIFPLEPAGNIQSTVYAVGEKAADIIKEDRARV
jgi:choline dehydrogenase-like flavoprotein